jgi:hypothetical protein
MQGTLPREDYRVMSATTCIVNAERVKREGTVMRAVQRYSPNAILCVQCSLLKPCGFIERQRRFFEFAHLAVKVVDDAGVERWFGAPTPVSNPGPPPAPQGATAGTPMWNRVINGARQAAPVVTGVFVFPYLVDFFSGNGQGSPGFFARPPRIPFPHFGSPFSGGHDAETSPFVPGDVRAALAELRATALAPEEVERAFGVRIREVHPDHNPGRDPADAARVIAARDRLREYLKGR